MKDFKNYKMSNEGQATVQTAAKKMQGKSEDEVIAEIIKIASERRSRGLLSDREIDEFVQKVTPMLDVQQRRKVVLLAQKLKRLPNG